MRDHRNPLAKARDAWLASKAGEACQAGTASGQYLRNRLERAFIAGWDARNEPAQRRPWLGPDFDEVVRRAEARGEQRLSKAQLDIIRGIHVTPEQLNRIGRHIGWPDCLKGSKGSD